MSEFTRSTWGQHLAYAEVQLCLCLCLCMPIYLCVRILALCEESFCVTPSPFLSSGHGFSCGILRESEGRREGRAICLLLTLSQWERRMDSVSRTLTFCQEENPRTKMGWYEKRRKKLREGKIWISRPAGLGFIWNALCGSCKEKYGHSESQTGVAEVESKKKNPTCEIHLCLARIGLNVIRVVIAFTQWKLPKHTRAVV